MKGQLPNPVQEVYSSDGWTQWNPLLSTENRPAHISSVLNKAATTHELYSQ